MNTQKIKLLKSYILENVILSKIKKYLKLFIQLINIIKFYINIFILYIL